MSDVLRRALRPPLVTGAVTRSRLLRLGVLLAAGLCLALLLPRVGGTTWRAVATAWQQLGWWRLGLLGALWFSGLVAHTWVLTGALPGLARRRALTLNLTGSAVANLVPLGGGLGVALNLVMLKRWGFTARESSLFTVLSNACSVAVKALLPLIAVALLLLGHAAVDPRVMVGGVIGSAALLLALGSAGFVMTTTRGAQVAAAAVHAVRPRASTVDVAARLTELRHALAAGLRRGGGSMALGSAAYSSLGAALLWCCLDAAGARAGVVAVVLLFAVERGLTALPFTPGGAGVADLVVTALAVHMLGSGPGQHDAITAGVLLYRAYTFGAEIPIGGLCLLAWLATSRRRPESSPVSEPAPALKAA